MFRPVVRSLSLAVIAAAGTASLSANGQESALVLEEIIVTARKRVESMQDVPIAVTAIGEAELQRSALRNLQDLQGYVPNLLIDKVTALPGGAAISIRGVSYQEIDKSLDPGIGVLLDGVYLGTNSGQILENFDLARVEVLRGPQGTLFGKNTIGGAINVFRTTPTKELGGKIQGTLGEDGRQDIRGLLNLPLTQNGGIKLWGAKLESDGYIRNTTYNDDAGGQDYENAGATIIWQFTDDLDLAFTYERTEDKSEVGAWANFNKFFDEFPYPIPGVAPADVAGLVFLPDPSGFRQFDTGSDEDRSSTNAPNDADVTNDYYNLTLNYDLGDWLVTSITGYVNRNENTRLEFDANRFEFMTSFFDQDYEQFSQEIRLDGTLGNVELTTGLYYWDSEYDSKQVTIDVFPFVAGLPEGSTGVLSQHGETESYAAFASADWAVTEKLTLNLGIRYTYEEKKLEPVPTQFFLGDIPLSPELAAGSFDEDWDKFSPRLGAQYDLTDDIMIYASYAEGFKSGGFFGRVNNLQNIRKFDPEEVETYEIGIRSDWWNQRLRINATLFSSDYKDKQEDVIVGDATAQVETVVLNAADASMDGVELEMSALLYEGLTFRAQAGYLDASYDEFIIDNIPGVPEDGSDLEMRNAPEYTFGAGLNYTHSLFEHSSMSYDVNYRWRDEYVTIFNNDPLGQKDSAGFWDANIDYRFKDSVTVSVYGRNLGDERYFRAVVIEPLVTFGQYNEPRNYGVTVTYEF